jgi:hypothetical protein
VLKKFISLLATAALSAAGVTAFASPAVASAGSPSGVNIGFAFTSESQFERVGSSASFLMNDGITLDNCDDRAIDSVNFQGCSFFHEFSIDDSASSSQSLGDLSYGTLAPYDLELDDSICDQDATDFIPDFMLTNFNCFNDNSYGQLFRPSTTGELDYFKMALTCLVPDGRDIKVTALLYEVEKIVDGGSTSSRLKGAPLRTTQITLSNCAESWQNKTFTAADFSVKTMDFGSPVLTAGTTYGVFFAGQFVPGTQLVEVDEESSDPDDDSDDTSGDVVRSAPAVFTGPIVNTPAIPVGVTPGSKLTLTGSNLSGVTKVEIGGLDAQVKVNAAGELEIVVPAGLAAGTYDIVLTSSEGRVTVQSAITIRAGAGLGAAGESRPSTKRMDDSSAKVYFYGAVGAGKIQFMLNGREIAWVNATDASDRKLTDGYLVRTVTLEPGKNVIEVLVDGVQVRRTVYSN